MSRVYRVDAAAREEITALPSGGAEVAFAAVDEGLLALRNNDSWDLLHAMIQQRSWGVETSTAQSEIIGRRHYGRKACRTRSTTCLRRARLAAALARSLPKIADSVGVLEKKK